jgi:ribonuclease Y
LRSTLDTLEKARNLSGMSFIPAAVLFVVAFLIVAKAAQSEASRKKRQFEAELAFIKQAGLSSATAERARAESEAREQLFKRKLRAKEEESRLERELHVREDRLSARISEISGKEQRLIARAAALEEREVALRAHEERRQHCDAERSKIEKQSVEMLESTAGESRAELRARMVADWAEEARGQAAAELRRIEQGVNDAEHAREAKRVMGIAIQRYEGHYLTERLLSNVPLLPDLIERIFGAKLVHLPAIEEVANIKLTVADDGTSVRLEGQDSFGREIARRAIHRFAKHGIKGEAKSTLLKIKEELEREVVDLGKRAFKELEIPRAHPEIVKLVGRLNWRTSYTQNQWKHAVESAFLCGMMACEMGLDVKIARRAALMHDIGKALTHEIDGSHAVIGADYARRLGEPEVVANAIGAHHADEPCNTVYASLVAAADAMSGARPGARREQTDNYVQRLEDLERIGRAFKGVESAFAVQGGREVRVYVKEDRVDDAGAVELSTEIAHRISDELTFPGQIKVTVIREMRSTAVAS